MSHKKVRPQQGDPLTDDMSERDIAATGILSRRQIQTFKKLAAIPEDEFEQILDSEKIPSANMIVESVRGNPARPRTKCCPHCGARIKKAPGVSRGDSLEKTTGVP